MASALAVVVSALPALRAFALDNGLGRTPPMGYNTWNDMGCQNINETNVQAVADAMVKDGFLEAGYEYLNLDDCWMADARDASGRLLGDLERFPSGMKDLADYVHAKGLKFGIYSDRGSKTCQGRPASLGNEVLDAQTFASWGVDYLKEDNCYSSTGPNNLDQLFKEFGLMRDALNATGRPIFFSVCGGGDNHACDNITFYASDPRGGAALANSWRTSADVTEWTSCQSSYLADNGLEVAAGPGGFNDPDMLLGSHCYFIMAEAQSRTQFNLWAILAAPLLLGSDLRSLSAWDRETYTNKEVIAVNQDPLAKQGRRIANATGDVSQASTSVWARELAGDRFAMVFLSEAPAGTPTSVRCGAGCWAQLPHAVGSHFAVRDLWTHGPAEAASATAGEEYQVILRDGGATSKILLFSPAVMV